MADKSAGEASVKIVPDAKNFIRDLEADLKRRKAEFAVTVTADTTRAALDIDRLRKEQEHNAINLKVKVDRSSTNEALNDLKSAFGDLGSAAGGVLGSLKFPAILAGIGELPAATTAIVNVAGALQQLSGAGAAIPGIFGGIASEVGTVKLALDGVDDAFKALDKASDGTAKNVKAANDALAKLAPSAADFVREVHDLTPAFDDLKKTVQGNFFEGLGTSVRQLADADLPVLNKGLGGIATALNGSLKQIGISLSSGSSQGLLDRIFGNTAEAQGRLTAAIDPLIKGIGTITAAGTDVLPRLADDVGSVAQRFAAFITEADQNGSLSKFINDGITGVEQLGNTFINVGKILNDITSSAGGDGGLLKFLDEGSAKLHTFLSSTEGQNKLKEWFEEGRRELNEHVIPLLQSLPGIFDGIVSAGRVFADDIVPPIRDVAKFLGEHPDALKLAIEGIVSAVVLTKVAKLAESLGTISGLLGGGLGGATGKGGKGGGLLGILGPGLALGGALGSAATDSSDPNSRTTAGLSALATIGGGAITGASVGGPWGAAVGALIGGAAALTDAFLDQAARVNAIEQKERDRIAKEKDAGVPPTPVIHPGASLQPAPSPLPVVNGQTGTSSVTDPTTTTGLGLVAAGVDQPKLVASQAQAAADDLAHLRDLITTLPTGQVTLKEDTPEAIKQLTDLGVKVTQIPGGTVNVDASSLANALAKAEQLHSTLLSIGNAAEAASSAVNNAASTPLHIGQGHAGGGVLPGYSPGVDNMLVPLAGGEGIVRPEAVRKYGPGVIHMLNQGFADGGLIPHLGTGALPGPADGGASGGGGILGGFLGHLFGGSNSTTGSDGKKDPASWLGEFGAKALTSFATTLFSGALGFFGLSSSNPYIQDIAKLIFGADGTTDSGGSSKAATSKQLREASDKITDKKNAVDVAQARVDGLKPTASASSRLSATNALTKAQREASQAVDDLAAIQPAQGYARGGIVGMKGYAEGVSQVPRKPITDIIPLQPPRPPSRPAPRPVAQAPSFATPPVPAAAPIPNQQQQPFYSQSTPTQPSSNDHNAPGVSTGITAGASAVGNALATAAAIGSFGAAGAGAGGLISGLANVAGKGLNDLVNIPSSFLVGNITPGTQGDNAYGTTVHPTQQQPATAQGRPIYNTFNGHDAASVIDQWNTWQAQDSQAVLATARG